MTTIYEDLLCSCCGPSAPSIARVALIGCLECDFTCLEERFLTRHVAEFHPTLFKCDDEHCDFFSREKRHLVQHILIKHENAVNQHQCRKCDEQFATESLLTEHLAKDHLSKLSGLQVKESLRKVQVIPTAIINDNHKKEEKDELDEIIDHDDELNIVESDIGEEYDDENDEYYKNSDDESVNYFDDSFDDESEENENKKLDDDFSEDYFPGAKRRKVAVRKSAREKKPIVKLQKKKYKFGCSYCKFSHFMREIVDFHEDAEHFEDKPDLSDDEDEEFNQPRCPLCGEMFPCNLDVYLHIESDHAKASMLMCKECDFETLNPGTMKRHKRIHHGEGVISDALIESNRFYQCDNCDFTHKLKTILSLHIRLEHEFTGEMNCPFCSEGFPSPQDIYSHVDKNHPKVMDKPAPKSKQMSFKKSSNSEYEFKCQFCDLTPSNDSSLRSHICQSHPGFQVQEHSCGNCNFSHWLKCVVEFHNEVMHGDESQEDVVCPLCRCRFGRADTIGRHLMTSHGKPELLICNIGGCDFTAFAYAPFERHRRQSHKLKSGDHEFKCKVEKCKFTHWNENVIPLHRTVQHGSGRLKCSECHQMFAKAEDVINHFVTVHVKKDEEILVSCNECDFLALNQTELSVHVHGVHDEFSKVACPYPGCNYMTHETRYITDHVRRVHKLNREQAIELDRQTMLEATQAAPGQVKKKVVTKTVNANLSCEFCERKNLTEKDLRSHLAENHSDKEVQEYFCSKCPFSHWIQEIVTCHENVEHGEESYGKCPTCNLPVKASQYDKHVRQNHQRPERILCTLCNIFTSSTYQEFCEHRLINHQLQKHHMNSKCNLCDFSHWSSRLVLLHAELAHNARTALNCDVCFQQFVSPFQLLYHFSIRHCSSTAQLLQCSVPKCEFASETRTDFLIHTYHEHRFEQCPTFHVQFSCSICKFVGYSTAEVIKHAEFAHMEQIFNHAEIGVKVLRCSYGECDYTTTDASSAMNHLIKNHRKDRLNAGAQKQDDGQKQQCSLCGDIFGSAAGLKAHVRWNHSAKEMKCLLCPEATAEVYSMRSDLLKHIKAKHKKAKVLTCRYCSFVAISEMHLEKHCKDEHDGRTGVKCNLCDYETTTKQNLNRHKIEVHPDQQAEMFMCDQCNFTTERAKSLKKHISTIHGSKKYSCPSCNFSTVHPCSLQRHIKALHEGVIASTNSDNSLSMPLI